MLTPQALFCIAVLLLQAPPSPPTTAPSTTSSSPAPTTAPANDDDVIQHVATDFVNALAVGDLAGVNANYTGTAANREVMNVLTTYVASLNKLSAAAETQFGPASPLARTKNPGKAMATAIPDGTIHKTGDKARIRLPGGLYYIDLLRTDAGWKVSNLSELENLESQVVKLSPGTKVINTMADEIAAGKFPNSTAAEEALTKRLRELSVRSPIK